MRDVREGAAEMMRAAADRRRMDEERARADRARHDEAFGHIERRHRDVWVLLTALKVLTCAIAGLFIAMGFNFWLCLAVAVIVWKAASGVTERNEVEDSVRRSVNGVN